MNKNKKRLAKKLDMDWETWDREKMSFPSSRNPFFETRHSLFIKMLRRISLLSKILTRLLKYILNPPSSPFTKMESFLVRGQERKLIVFSCWSTGRVLFLRWSMICCNHSVLFRNCYLFPFVSCFFFLRKETGSGISFGLCVSSLLLYFFSLWSWGHRVLLFPASYFVCQTLKISFLSSSCYS